MRNILSVLDVSDDISLLIQKGLEIAQNIHKGYTPLQGKIIGIYFRVPSTRTRTSFSAGAIKLGASIISYGPNELQLSTGETPSDTARVLSSYLDGLIIRTNDSIKEMQQMAQQGIMPIVNAMSNNEHPTQVIGDLIAIHEQFGRLDDLHILYIGEGNNTAASLSLAVALMPNIQLTLITPEGYGLEPNLLHQAQSLATQSGSNVSESHDINAIPRGVDVVYTTRWQTMGVHHTDPRWRDRFSPFKVTSDIMARVSKCNTVFMHDLPAIRGSEVDDEVLDGKHSIAFRQAFHKMTSAMVILDYCFSDES